eukprot:GHVS01059029.1.p1 GENE.GHVS01059029.1~~GHVS01059029.1.p1  ORF type:complete len:355 (-),score=53.71 GHVS01059029.1:156-1220(-)
MGSAVNVTSSLFEQKYQNLKNELLDEMNELDISANIQEELKTHYARLLDHSVHGGKMTRGLTVVKALESLKGSETTEEDKQAALVLGWCVEWLQAFFLTADDVMDNSHMRRNLPCWFRMEGVTATNAINDSLFLNSCIYRIMKRHLSSRKDYVELCELMHEMTYTTVIGQHLDTNAQPIGTTKVDLARATEDRYQAIVRYKTAFYSFYLPCALGMTIAGIREKAAYDQAKSICLSIGEYFQAQDDVLDCFTPPEILGKVGTDIEEKKCSWLLVQVMKVATQEEIDQLRTNYGVNDKSKIEWVKTLYKKYDLQVKFKAYEEQHYQTINKLVTDVPNGGLQSLFQFLLARLYKRTY